MVEPVIEQPPGDPDGEIAHVGEIGQPHPARLVDLTEDHFLIRAVDRPPAPDPSLHGPAHAIPEIGMPP